MENQSEDMRGGSLGLLYWNVWYRAEPADQLQAVRRLDRTLQDMGADRTILCLSEATRGLDKDGLVDMLQTDGYDTTFRPTSDIGWAEEGLCFASKSAVVNAADFRELRTARGLANMKTRWLGRLCLDDTSVFTTHTSYPFPSKQEIAGITEALEEDKWDRGGRAVQVLGGDFNTLLSKRIVPIFEACGLTKLETKRRLKHTVPLGKVGMVGVELDHAFISTHQFTHATIDIGRKGPSNHKPLLVTVG